MHKEFTRMDSEKSVFFPLRKETNFLSYKKWCFHDDAIFMPRKKKLPKNTVQMYFHSQKDYLEFIEKNDEPYLTIVFVQKEIKNKSVYTVTALTYDLFILKIENL